MRQINQRTIIFSVSTDRNTERQNRLDTAELVKDLTARHVAFKTVIGVYNGEQEVSIVVPLNQPNARVGDLETYIRHQAIVHSQECILVLNEDRNAYLDYLNGDEPFYIGQFKGSKTKPAGDYTFDVEHGLFYEVI